MGVDIMTKLKNSMIQFYNKYKHFGILSYFLVYLLWFSYVEKNVTTHFHVIHMKIDDLIPFCEYFIIPYLLWFLFVAWGVLYMGFHNKKDFYRLCTVLFTGMTIFLIISTLYPNGHFLRPYYFSRHNIFTMLCELLYQTDTPTNLFPSIHVYNSLAVWFAIINNDTLKKKKTLCFLSFILTSSIILATVFLKQHSVFDVITAFLLAGIMYQLVYVRSAARTSKQTNKKLESKKSLSQL